MINRIITWLRRDDQELEWLRRDVQQQEKHMEWDALQKICLYVIYITVIMGFGLILAFWITA